MTAPKQTTRLGWLGPAIVILGIVVAGLGTWFVIVSRPEAGAVLDTIPIDATQAFVVRAEDGGDRNFVELREGERVLWQAITPPYAGRPGAPGIAWNDKSVTVRVIRSGRAEVFAVSRTNGSKLGGFKLAPTHGDVVKGTIGPVTLSDHFQAYEFVSGPGWTQLVVIDLATGDARWKQELGATAVETAGLEREIIWVSQGGQRRAFRVVDGSETRMPSSS